MGKILFKKHIQVIVYHQEKDVSGPNLVTPSLHHRQRQAIVFSKASWARKKCFYPAQNLCTLNLNPLCFVILVIFFDFI